MRPLLAAVSVLVWLQAPAQGPANAAAPPAHVVDFNAAMMDSTFKIMGPSTTTPGQLTGGTGFLVGRKSSSRPGLYNYVLVTAAHVFDGVKGDTAVLVLRVSTPTTKYVRTEVPIKIRDASGVPLFTRHRTADVAAMYVLLPSNLAQELIAEDLLATDEVFDKYELHPGDEVLAVGYPYGVEANAMGFPILRSGRIASFPLTPAATVQTFLVDFSMFGGNSGSPVYVVQTGRAYGNSVHLGERLTCIVGLVSQQLLATTAGERLGVASVVPAQFIKETIDQLPPE